MKNKIQILYASQTGNSQDIAETIFNEAINYGIHADLKALDEYPIENLINENLVMFVCSTTGQGDEPDNMKLFWKFLLRKNLPTNSLTKLNFAILGLGDSSYSKYNYVAKRLNKRLIQLGATPFFPLMLIDEQHPLGPEALIEEWHVKIWKIIFYKFGLTEKYTKPEVYLKPALKYNFVEVKMPLDQDEINSNYTQNLISSLSPSCSPLYYATVEENTRLTPPDHFQDSRLITMEVSNYKFQPFDILMVHPQNRPETVSEFIEMFKLDPDQLWNVSITPEYHPTPKTYTSPVDDKPTLGDRNYVRYNFSKRYPHLGSSPCPSTLDIITKFMDLQSVPRRSFFRHLAYYAHTARNLIQDFINQNYLSDHPQIVPKNDISEEMVQELTQHVTSLVSASIASSKSIESSTADGSKPKDGHDFESALSAYMNRLDAERERLEEMCIPNDSGREELFSYCNRVRRSILEVLVDFPATSLTIPLAHLVSIIPHIQPRPFSIANAYGYPLDEQYTQDDVNINQKLQILVAVVEYKTKLYKPRRGTCSYWLSTLPVTAKLPVWIKSGYVTLPNYNLKEKDEHSPIILVGPGTGVAPLRALIEKRVKVDMNGTHLFFGCRNKGKDQYFAQEFDAYQSEKLLKVYNAFSRDQNERIYVQHIIKQESALVYDLLFLREASVFISGRSKNMPDEVLAAFAHSLKAHGDFNEESAKLFIEKLIVQKKIQMETWS